MKRAHLWLALLIPLAAAAPAQTTHRVQTVFSVLPLSPAAQRRVDAWLARAAPWQARLAAIPADAPLAANLAERVAVDQGMRLLLSPSTTLDLPEADRIAANNRIFGALVQVDLANIAWLKTVIPQDGWFRISRDGRDATHNAWLLVQHSPDQALMYTVVARMAPLAKTGEVDGADYALLYDRIEVFAGRPQYYGSQYSCKGGRYVHDPIRDPAGVDARRKALGMSSLADNAARINRNNGPCSG